MEIRIFGVIIAGQMGSGIAQVAAMSGLEVIMNDIRDEFVEQGFKISSLSPAAKIRRSRLAGKKNAKGIL